MMRSVKMRMSTVGMMDFISWQYELCCCPAPVLLIVVTRRHQSAVSGPMTQCSDRTTPHADIDTYYSVSVLLNTLTWKVTALSSRMVPLLLALKGPLCPENIDPWTRSGSALAPTHWALICIYIYICYFSTQPWQWRWPQLGHFILIARFWWQRSPGPGSGGHDNNYTFLTRKCRNCFQYLHSQQNFVKLILLTSKLIWIPLLDF